MFNIGAEEITHVCGEEEKFTKKFSPFVNGENIIPIYNELNVTMERISGYANPQIVFTDLAMKLVKLINKK